MSKQHVVIEKWWLVNLTLPRRIALKNPKNKIFVIYKYKTFNIFKKMHATNVPK